MEELTNIFKALSDGTRLRILKPLEGGDLCVCDGVTALDLIQPKVSFHLSVLKNAKLLKGRREGRWMRYKIDNSDLFKRLIILSVLEKSPEKMLKTDNKRLEEFLTNKPDSPLSDSVQGVAVQVLKEGG
jgi:ArsR family transcriptional regulator